MRPRRWLLASLVCPCSLMGKESITDQYFIMHGLSQRDRTTIEQERT